MSRVEEADNGGEASGIANGGRLRSTTPKCPQQDNPDPSRCGAGMLWRVQTISNMSTVF